ncbi:MAG: chain-length determining protein [Paraprevotella sp.]|jgi:chain length determinant protein family|nr:chain-length determining protein [Paraprevotella sp.]MBP3471291.1 chain-length determining protein [Paraprevotella sp.]
METSKEQLNQGKKTKEIDILFLFFKLIREWKFLSVFCSLFGLVGLVVALNTSKYFTTTVVLSPESSDNSAIAGKLGSVGSLLGLKMGSMNTADAIYPEIYPDIFASTDFLVTLFDIPVTSFEEGNTKTYFNHITQDAKIPFWSYPMLWIRNMLAEEDEIEKRNPGGGVNPFMLTKKQMTVCEVIRNRISCLVDKKTGVITLSVTDNDKLIAASMADTVMNRLQQYITVYRTKKARHDLEFMEHLYEQAKADYLKAQSDYATLADSNHDVALLRFKSQMENMENEMQLKYTVYSEAAQQLIMAKQKVQEKTPAFTIIQGATVSLKASSMPRLYILILFVFLGGVSGAAWILYLRDFYGKYVKQRRK